MWVNEFFSTKVRDVLFHHSRDSIGGRFGFQLCLRISERYLETNSGFAEDEVNNKQFSLSSVFERECFGLILFHEQNQFRNPVRPSV
jgi:hypothetical protein